MNRRHIIILIIALYVVTGTVATLWTLQLGVASRTDNLVSAQVLGASTENAEAIQLAPYPVEREGIRKPIVNARQFALYHAESGKLLYEKDAEKAVPIASTTKLMTSYVTLKLGNDLEEIVTISPETASVGGSLMGLRAGEKISVRNLLYGLMMVSGNDCAHALAAFYGGRLLNSSDAPESERVERFVQEMNTVAKKLGMTSTSYKDPAGLNDEGRSTAFDLAKLMTVVTQNQVIKEITTTATTTVSDVSGNYSHELKNSNRLVAEYMYEGVIGGKTGFTPDAGHCLVSAVTRNGNTLIAVILSTFNEQPDASAVENRKLLDWGFSAYTFN